jgi:hypothetical protein
LHAVSDGSLLIADAATRGWSGEFGAGDWEQIGRSYRMVIPHSRHKVARDRNLVASVRDGDAVQCDVKVEKSGTVTFYSPVAFGGNVLIYGGLSPLVATDLLTNSMTVRGDIIYAAHDSGTQDRLPIGTPDQALHDVLRHVRHWSIHHRRGPANIRGPRGRPHTSPPVSRGSSMARPGTRCR